MSIAKVIWTIFAAYASQTILKLLEERNLLSDAFSFAVLSKLILKQRF